MLNFEDAFEQENVVYISYPNGNIYKKQDGKILQNFVVPEFHWKELTEDEIKELKNEVFQSWKQRFGSEPEAF